MKRKCKDCIFWEPSEDLQHVDSVSGQEQCLVGECRCKCPSVQYFYSPREGGEHRKITVFPETFWNEWCGEYINREDIKAAQEPLSAPDQAKLAAFLDHQISKMRFQTGFNGDDCRNECDQKASLVEGGYQPTAEPNPDNPPSESDGIQAGNDCVSPDTNSTKDPASASRESTNEA